MQVTRLQRCYFDVDRDVAMTPVEKEGRQEKLKDLLFAQKYKSVNFLGMVDNLQTPATGVLKVEYTVELG